MVINLPGRPASWGIARPENLFRPGGTHFISHSICSFTLSFSLCLSHSVYFSKYRLPQLIWLFIYCCMFNLHWPYILPNIDLFLPFLVLLWICFKGQYFLLKMGLPIFSNFNLKLRFGGHLALWACDTISYPLWWGGRGNNPQRCSHDRLQFSTVIVSLLGVSAAGRTCYGRANIQWLLINVGSPYSTRTKGKQICPPLCLLTWSNIVSKIRAKKKKKTSFQLKLKFQLKFRFKNNPSGLVKHLKKQWLYLDTHKHVVSICYA